MRPRSLFGRVALILFVGLVVAHALSFWLILRAQGQTALAMMINYLPKDIASSVAILERVPAAERPAWLERLARRNYRYTLDASPPGAPLASERLRGVVDAIGAALGPGHALTASVPAAGDGKQVQLDLRLRDGAPLTIALTPPPIEVSMWVSLVLVAQFSLLGVVTWTAVRLTTRPLAALADAADTLGPDFAGAPLREDGPREVARAAVAFNAMQRRIEDHLAERLQILAAVSHDLQTPIARMALRADLLDDPTLREKLHADLRVMQVLVEEGIAYARSAHVASEPPRRIDLHALLDSLVCDYGDAGRAVRLVGEWSHPFTTRPESLRRVVGNLVDNALAFATDVELAIEPDGDARVALVVRDRGPGIPPHELAAVLQPFHRVEGSRSRATGGTGLGLAIADQLTRGLGGTLTLANREGGGLEARVTLPAS
jgi:signal transduction histidine kinase